MYKKNRILCELISFCLLSNQIFSTEFEEWKFHIISIGSDCEVTSALESLHLKQESYPFEWNISDFSAVYQALKDDFRDFTNPDFFSLYFDNRSPKNKYGVVLAHNFPLVFDTINEKGEELFKLDPNWRDLIPEITRKYARRINRFRKACCSSKKVFFVRYPAFTKDEALQISNILSNRYPNLDYNLVCIIKNYNKYSPGLCKDKVDKRIVFYSINPTKPQGDLNGWEDIFSDLGCYSECF